MVIYMSYYGFNFKINLKRSLLTNFQFDSKSYNLVLDLTTVLKKCEKFWHFAINDKN